MIKHVMLVSYGIDGVELDSWACAPWPYPSLPPREFDAMRVMLGMKSHTVPAEVQELVETAIAMEVRGRFQSNARFVVLNDETNSITTRDEMLNFLKTCSKADLKRYMGTGQWIHGRGVRNGMGAA